MHKVACSAYNILCIYNGIFKSFTGIRTSLLESEEHTCPTCHQTDVSPDNLIANKFLRQVTTYFTLSEGTCPAVLIALHYSE